MLSQMNKVFHKYPSVVGGVLLAIIVVPFILFTDGGQSVLDSYNGSGPKDYVGTVNEQEISHSEYRKLYAEMNLASALETGRWFNSSSNQSAKNATLFRKAMLAEIKPDLNTVNAADMKEYFKTSKGVASIRKREKFENAVQMVKVFRRYFSVSGLVFDRVVKENILLNRHRDELKSAQTVSDEEAKNSFLKDNTTYTVLEKKFTTEANGLKILSDYYAANKKDFTFADARKSHIVIFKATSYLKRTKNLKKGDAYARQAASLFQKSIVGLTADRAFTKATSIGKFKLEESTFVSKSSLESEDYYLGEKKLSEKIYTLTKEAPLSSVVKIDGGYAVAFFKKLGYVQSFKEARTAILEKLYGEKKALYYENNKKNYAIPEMIKTSAYVLRNASIPKVDVKPEEVKASFEQNKALYSKPQVKIVTVSASKPEKAKEATSLKALLTKVAPQLAGADAKKLTALRKNLSTQSAFVSELAWRNETDLSTKILAAVKKLKAGQASSLIEDKGSYLLVALAARRTETPFDEAAKEIKSQITASKQAAQATEAMAAFSATVSSLTKAENFAEVVAKQAEEKGVERIQFTEVAAGQGFNFMDSFRVHALNLLQDRSNFMTIFTALSELNAKKPYTTTLPLVDGQMLLVVDSSKESTFEDLKTVTPQVLEGLLDEAATEKAKATAAAFYAEKKDFTGDWKTLGFKANKAAKNTALASEFATIVEGETFTEKKLYSYADGQDTVLALVSATTAPKEEEVKKALPALKKKLLTEKQNKALQEFGETVSKKVTLVQDQEQIAANQDEK